MAESTGIGQKLATQLAQLSAQRWAAGLSVLFLAISGLFGGLDYAGDTTTALDKPIEAGPWTVTVTGARVVGKLAPMRLSDEKNFWVVVLATVEITADSTWRYPKESVQLAATRGITAQPVKTLAGVEVQQYTDIVLVRDSTVVNQLHPGMPEKLAYFWELESTAPIPKEVKVYIGFRELRQNSLDGHMNWLDASEHNQSVTVPVVDRRAETAASL